jgi:hypothetical protein
MMCSVMIRFSGREYNNAEIQDTCSGGLLAADLTAYVVRAAILSDERFRRNSLIFIS